MNSQKRSRSGVTILEVLFAIGVVIVGLLGIASILPVAGHQASESARAAESQALAQDWYAEIFTRQLHHSSSWIYYNDLASSPGYVPYAAIGTGKTGTPNCVFPRVVNKQPVCIDPMFFTDPDLRSATMPSAPPYGFVQSVPSAVRPVDRWYRPSVFPYYQDRYNPTVDPAYEIDTTVAWGEQPRMVRVTFPTPGAAGIPAGAKFVEQVFASQDELAIATDLADSSIPPVRMPALYDNPPASGNTLPIARTSSETNYSWIATLSPNETFTGGSVEFGTLSLVVIYKRDRIFFDPNSAGTLPTLRTGPPTPTEKPVGERMAWVVPISGDFLGGTAGRVRLISSDGVPDSLHIGDWVMLSKYAAINSSGLHSVFRWYRVIAANDAVYGRLTDVADVFGNVKDFTVQNSAARVPPKNFTSSGVDRDPYGLAPPSTDNVWSRDVVLDGPDWDFSITAGAVTTPTTATMVHGAVAVIERIVELK